MTSADDPTTPPLGGVAVSEGAEEDEGGGALPPVTLEYMDCCVECLVVRCCFSLAALEAPPGAL